ncbi:MULTISPECIES: RtcB family protein [unclassified Imperialibacter]|uniref:RtcB family protein n=1 Tax=unclassified Imperialibacter TaxID=2629706 RepID=UPI00125448B4|nr:MULTISPECIES: RtcB family protein [unclassified Imperialibacter]CAD5293214.1 Protein RtcB [Imperialibacter sp. 89]CAD5294309.1 Protein RtcB [Imperialibacter sp. 75]VVT18413.1 Protein RtcB [Imperialibacter sp. EC-SDR9]
MATTKITGKELRALGYPEGRAIGSAVEVMETHYKGKSKMQKLELLARVLQTPGLYAKHETLGPVATSLIIKTEHNQTIELNARRLEYSIYGAEAIEQGAIHQMEIAMKLPVTVAGALMPDAHQGYGLPIGGVLATNNAVIPYGVGVDIGCRMCMTLYDIPASYASQHTDELRILLMEHTRFGNAGFKRPEDDEVFSRKVFSEINILKALKDRAYLQIGTSGGGNHFVEFGVAELVDESNELGLPIGRYLAVLSHSGSRGLGANIARHYTKLAMDKCKLPGEAKHLAWLDLDTEDGQEYWLAMNLAGDYASACHHQIHRRLAKALGEQPLAMIENHHNFAWKERDAAGNDIIVHRKGATPAGKGVLGIIPGSMTSPGFIVRGKGEANAINSAAHGAGRVMSRTKAKETLSKQEVRKHLKKAGIELIGSGLDEAPMVYKDIHQVMAFQQELVEVVGSFTPKVVRMCGDERFAEVD